MVRNIAVSLSGQSFIRPICLQEQTGFELLFKSFPFGWKYADDITVENPAETPAPVPSPLHLRP